MTNRPIWKWGSCPTTLFLNFGNNRIVYYYSTKYYVFPRLKKSYVLPPKILNNFICKELKA